MRRTQVIDDETDYYKGVKEEKIREKKHGSRKDKKFTLNLLTDEVQEQTMQDFIEEHKEEEKVDLVKKNRKENLFYNEDLQNNNLHFTYKTETERKGDKSGVNESEIRRNKEEKKKRLRLQDTAIMEMYDSGKWIRHPYPRLEF